MLEHGGREGGRLLDIRETRARVSPSFGTSWSSDRPTVSLTISPCERAEAGFVRPCLPSRGTVTTSAISFTSPSLWLMKTIRACRR
jgi:hypothetical protein